MSSLDRIYSYLADLERRFRLNALVRGAAVVALVALGATIVAVLLANSRAFSDSSVRLARVLMFLAVALALAFGLCIPVLQLNRRRVARRAELQFPTFKQRLLTFIDKPAAQDPFLELLAADTLGVAAEAKPHAQKRVRAVKIAWTGILVPSRLEWP